MKVTIFNVLYKFIYLGDFQINRMTWWFFRVVFFFGVFKTLIIYKRMYLQFSFIQMQNVLRKEEIKNYG